MPFCTVYVALTIKCNHKKCSLKYEETYAKGKYSVNAHTKSNEVSWKYFLPGSFVLLNTSEDKQ